MLRQVGSLLGLIALAAAACSTPSTSGESHFGVKGSFLRVCEDGICASGDSCACAVCTVPCQDLGDCAERLLGSGASPDDLPDSVTCAAPACFDGVSDEDLPASGSVCEVLCDDEADCAFLDEEGTYACVAGRCRTTAELEEPMPVDVLGPACPQGRALVPADSSPLSVGLCVDETEVTVVKFRDCVDVGECTPPDAGNYFTTGFDTHPVNFVTMLQAETYCAFAGARLPTHGEFTAAARGDESWDYPFGAVPAASDAPALVCGFDQTSTCETGSHAAGDGPFDHADLSGNVAEIVLGDSGPCSAGGHYAASVEQLAIAACEPLGEASATVGFRCASEL